MSNFDSSLANGSEVTGSRETPESTAHEDACAICLEPLLARAVAVPCNHLDFDFPCLVTWLREQPSCPLCKTPVDRVEYDWASAEDYKIYKVPREDERSLRKRAPRRPACPRRDYALERRQRIYEKRTPCLHVGSHPRTGYKDITTDIMIRSLALQRKARVFLRRELRVFPFLHASPQRARNTTPRGNTYEYLIEYIVFVLKLADVKGSDGKAEDMVTEHLGRENARLLLHELLNFLRSPFERLNDWDAVVQYPPTSCRVHEDNETSQHHPG